MGHNIINQSNEHTNELVQEVIGKDGLSMTVDIASSENGIHGYFGKLFVLELSHIVDQDSYRKMRKHLIFKGLLFADLNKSLPTSLPFMAESKVETKFLASSELPKCPKS